MTSHPRCASPQVLHHMRVVEANFRMDLCILRFHIYLQTFASFTRVGIILSLHIHTDIFVNYS